MRKLELERGEQESEEVENSAPVEKQQKSAAAKNRQGKKIGRGEQGSVTKKRKSQDTAANEGEVRAEKPPLPASSDQNPQPPLPASPPVASPPSPSRSCHLPASSDQNPSTTPPATPTVSLPATPQATTCVGNPSAIKDLTQLIGDALQPSSPLALLEEIVKNEKLSRRVSSLENTIISMQNTQARLVSELQPVSNRLFYLTDMYNYNVDSVLLC
ncbi:hypothetical protein GBAR_LOCUS27541 [Geodia barretti]|uniref:Uncharacterized protein n=1 Tax=Geodia barretti TaxID=519541 RepID=A0AA35XAB1_GEOBA|nr:hypothetical protein GBAR_LOCUS27541 [Geodia barretti]